MDVALIEMPAEVATEELKKYRRSLHRRADAEYQEIAIGLEKLAEGTPLLTLASVFATVPLDEKGRPRIAIARADRMRVRMTVNGWQRSEFVFDSTYDRRRGPMVRDGVVRAASALATSSMPAGYAIVPIVPPDVRGTKDLSRFFTLWEVERWADHAREVGPDRDPLLLQRLSVDLWAVVGSWDLSPIEQAILAGRRTA